MMNNFLHKILLSLLLLFSMTAYSSSKKVEKQNMDFIFIGSPYSVSVSNLDCNQFLKNRQDADYLDICMESALEITYKVSDVILGAIQEKKLTFYIFRHGFGFPAFLKNDASYIHIRKINNVYLLIDSAYVFSDPINYEDLICRKELRIQDSLKLDVKAKWVKYKNHLVDNCNYVINLDDFVRSIKKSSK